MNIDSHASFSSGPSLYKAVLLYRDTNCFPNAHLACAFDAHSGELTNGTFLTDKDLKKLFKGIHSDLSKKVDSEKVDYQLHDPRVLASGDSFLCFEIPAHERTLFFGENLPKIGKEPVPLPRMIAILKGSSSYLVAVKAKGRITERTPLYHAPVPENDPKGRIHDCGFKWPKNRFLANNVEDCTTAILDSQKLNSRHKKLCKGDYAEVIEVARKQKKFPNDALVSMDRRLGDLFASF